MPMSRNGWTCLLSGRRKHQIQLSGALKPSSYPQSHVASAEGASCFQGHPSRPPGEAVWRRTLQRLSSQRSGFRTSRKGRRVMGLQTWVYWQMGTRDPGAGLGSYRHWGVQTVGQEKSALLCVPVSGFQFYLWKISWTPSLQFRIMGTAPQVPHLRPTGESSSFSGMGPWGPIQGMLMSSSWGMVGHVSEGRDMGRLQPGPSQLGPRSQGPRAPTQPPSTTTTQF